MVLPVPLPTRPNGCREPGIDAGVGEKITAQPGVLEQQVLKGLRFFARRLPRKVATHQFHLLRS
jgi:hypothetical protein